MLMVNKTFVRNLSGRYFILPVMSIDLTESRWAVTKVMDARDRQFYPPSSSSLTVFFNLTSFVDDTSTSSMTMFRPQYNQPFTIEEALALDPPIITEEISRLQNSIQHLERSNHDLNTFLESETDPDVALALRDNKVTIATQTERIQILQIALGSKLGIRVSDSHYAPNPIQTLLASSEQSRPADTTDVTMEPIAHPVPSAGVSTETAFMTGQQSSENGTSGGIGEEDSEEGVYL